MEQNNAIYREQSRLIQEFAEKSDCVIVGRSADYILREKHPFRLFASLTPFSSRHGYLFRKRSQDAVLCVPDTASTYSSSSGASISNT